MIISFLVLLQADSSPFPATSSRNGVILKTGAQAVEALSKTTTIILDKTGTVTTGKQKLSRYIVRRNCSEWTWWAVVHSTEYEAQHWVNESVSKHIASVYGTSALEKMRLEMSCQNHKVYPGYGVSAVCNSQAVVIGNRNHLIANGIECTADMQHDLRWVQAPESYVLIAINGHYSGIITFLDEIAEGVTQAISDLKSLGYNVSMVTTSQYDCLATHTDYSDDG